MPNDFLAKLLRGERVLLEIPDDDTLYLAHELLDTIERSRKVKIQRFLLPTPIGSALMCWIE